MIRFFAVLAFLFLCSPSHAEDNTARAFRLADGREWQEASAAAHRTGNRLLAEYVQWRRLRDVEKRPAAEEILTFIEHHPAWPDLPVLVSRAGEALMLEGLNQQNAARWLVLHESISQPPQSPDRQDPIAALIRHTWIRGDFNASEQKLLRQRYPAHINPGDVAARTRALLWQDSVNRARDMIPSLPQAEQKLAYARIALQTNQHGIDGVIASVPKHLIKDSGLIYDRMRWRARRKLNSGVRELLLQASEKVPFPEKWWNYRAYEIRELIESQDHGKALALARNHGQTGGATLADALWLKGWLELKHARNASAAYEDFYALYHHVSYPVSLSRGAFWAGVAAKQNGNQDIARNWFAEAAKHPTTFYGQLALAELQPGRMIVLPAAGDEGGEGHFSSDQRDLLNLIRLLAKYNQKSSVEKFVQHLASLQQSPQNLHALGRICQHLGMPSLKVRIGKVASQQRHLWLGATSHPLVKTEALAIEPALALAISRQESEFDPRARSSANALGLMQLLPGTAKHTAKRWGIPYSYEKLFDPKYNMELGSYYLAGLIDKFNGSYPLAIAAYNAGPGNVTRWIATYGPYPQDPLSQLHWLESIPFAETRNYVQRVLENLHVYRAMLGEQKPLTAESVLLTAESVLGR